MTDISRPILKASNTNIIILCFAIIYIVWGSTYLFATFAIEQIPAFRLCGYRYVIASFVTLGITFLFFRPTEWPTKQQVINAAKAGFIFMGLGTGGAIWALNYLDSGLTALIISGEPLVILLMMWVVNRARPANNSFIGVALGIVGMFLLVSQSSIVSGPGQWQGVGVIFLSMLAWGYGSIYVSKVELPKSDWLNSAIQMFVGGVSTFIIGIFIGESGVPIREYTSLTYISVSFLIVFGSVMAFTAFNYLLRNVSTEKVVTNTYINHIVAMLLGNLFNDELVTGQSILAACFMLSGVFIINTTKQKKKSLS